MSPVRILILGVLFYFLYKMIFSKKKVAGDSATVETSEENPLQDVLVEDPVCHVFIPKEQAESLRFENEVYYFCSHECCETFLKQRSKKESD